jgi:hypothetical protein
MATTLAAALHGVLFPIGPRQRAAIDAFGTGTSAETALLAIHRGIARALESVVTDLGTPPHIADWMLLRDSGIVSAMLWDGAPNDTAAALFARELARRGDLGTAYCRSVAPDLRHRLGEHYTPRWLVRRMADLIPGSGTVADPACGDGRFLIALLGNGYRVEELWGAELNPLAVIMSRINMWTALGKPADVSAIRIVWGDFIFATEPATAPRILTDAARNVSELPPARMYVGNPPWVTWRNLSEPYREAVAGKMSTSRLHHARGWAARVSAGQTDLAHIFVHEAIERVEPGGHVAFVLPRSVFKAPTGPGRLREGVSTSGRKYRFTEIWDCEGADPFTGVRTDTVVARIDVDQPHTFPVPWISTRDFDSGVAVLSDPEDASSPWLTGNEPVRLAGGQRWTDLRARGGVNTGGGNSVFHVEVLATDGDMATIRNVLSRRSPTEVITADIETSFLRPLLRGRDISPWHAVPSLHIVVPHDSGDLRKPVDESTLRADSPFTYRYLTTFREFLASRREVARWNSPHWYTLFRIGPYTAGCWRVVWPHSANGRLRAAVLMPDDPAVPDQKVVLVPFADRSPALFLCALLNSSFVRAAASGSAGMDASPNLVRRLILPRFEPDNATHARIVELAGNADVSAEISSLFAG